MRKYGIIGLPLGHSFSKKYFENKFQKNKWTDCVFENYELPNIKGVEALIQDPSLKGFCITIPYKRAIIPYLDKVSDAVRATQACNCVRIEDGRLFGFNTDVVGFEQSFVPHLNDQDKKALVLGTGGAAAAVCYVLEKLGLAFEFVSRNPGHNQLSYEAAKDPAVLRDYTVIINCSPVGTFPKQDQAPDLDYSQLTPRHYLYDLVYNPPMTQFLKHGKDSGARVQNGFPMLEIQAEENWKHWNSL